MNDKPALRGVVTAREEFLYPDTPSGELPETLSVAMARNGRPGIQLLLDTDAPEAVCALEGDGFGAEWFAMIDVPVEYNTGDGLQQGGAMVLEQRPAQKPAYAARLAPFRVYDCLRPSSDGRVFASGGRAACYLCLTPAPDLAPGRYSLALSVRCGGQTYRCALQVRVYDVLVPEKGFSVTNWFSLEAIRRFHQVADGTSAYYDMVRRYARMMRRARQTMFYIELDDRCVASRDPYTFRFDHLRPLIGLFFEEGMNTLELGPLLSRGFLPDGMPDMYTDQFKCAMAPDVPVDSFEGYALMSAFVRALAAFLKENGWAGRVVFHIHDEPDIHYRDDAALQARRRQYLLTADILRRHLPGVRVIEAVDSTAFRGGVDIWVPVTASYERSRDQFRQLAALGEEIWTYVCCTPQGHWLNRFLDLPLLRGRLLFWGCAANRMQGFLHWGFNQFQLGMDPFRGTSCPNHTGIGTNFPCGDSFIVYPGADGPWPSMRLEAARRGAEDAALLALLRSRDEDAHDRLVARAFTDNSHYQDDPAAFEVIWEDLLAALEQISRVPAVQ